MHCSNTGAGSISARLDLDSARFHLREIEDRVDQREQLLSARQDFLQILELLRLELFLRAAHHDARKADDRVQRRAKLVRHVGKKCALMPASDFELPALVFDLAEQPRILDGQRGLCREGLQADRSRAARTHPHFSG